MLEPTVAVRLPEVTKTSLMPKEIRRYRLENEARQSYMVAITKRERMKSS